MNDMHAGDQKAALMLLRAMPSSALLNRRQYVQNFINVASLHCDQLRQPTVLVRKAHGQHLMVYILGSAKIDPICITYIYHFTLSLASLTFTEGDRWECLPLAEYGEVK